MQLTLLDLWGIAETPATKKKTEKKGKAAKRTLFQPKGQVTPKVEAVRMKSKSEKSEEPEKQDDSDDIYAGIN